MIEEDIAMMGIRTATSVVGKILGFSAKAAYSALTKENETYDIDPLKSNNPSKVNLICQYNGFVFGKMGDDYVVKDTNTDGHIAVIGGAGSGKTSCIAISSLMAWEGRVFAIDIKGELYKKTKDIRTNANVMVFNPLDNDAYGYDPYASINSSDNTAQEIREIALILAPPDENVKDPFWINSEQNLLTACISHFYYLEYEFIETMEEIVSTPIEELIKTLVNSENREARLYANQFNGMDNKTLSGIYGGLCNKIMVFATDEDVRDSLSNCMTIDPSDIESGFDIYLCIPEYKLEQWKNILTLIVNQFIRHFEKRQEREEVPTLFLLDEFARLGKINTMANALATLRSKNITVAIFLQSLAQLDYIYGKDQRRIMLDNCQYKAILSASDPDTQELLSRLVGTYDKMERTTGESYEPITGFKSGSYQSVSPHEKRKIKPEDFGTLDEIILQTPKEIMRIEKAPYYEN